jgi:type VI protein secretion system component VasK
MNQFALALTLVASTVLAQDAAKTTNKPLPQESQIKLLKAQRQLQQIQLQIQNLQRQYDQAVKDARELQAQMSNDCSEAAKQSNVNLSNFSCDLDSLTFAPRPEEKKPDVKKGDEKK